MLLRLLGTAAVMVALQASFPANSGQTLRERYGQPVSEDFLVRPGVIATATYGASGKVCQIVISPQRLWNSTLASKHINEITDELVPRSERGKVATGGFLNSGCPTNDCSGTIYNWENISIIRMGSNDQTHYATIEWHRDECTSRANR